MNEYEARAQRIIEQVRAGQDPKAESAEPIVVESPDREVRIEVDPAGGVRLDVVGMDPRLRETLQASIGDLLRHYDRVDAADAEIHGFGEDLDRITSSFASRMEALQARMDATLRKGGSGRGSQG